MFNDKNRKGIKDGNENPVLWAGVTIKLTKK